MTTVYNLKAHGELQVSYVNREHLNELQGVCDVTPCFSTCHPVKFSPRIQVCP